MRRPESNSGIDAYALEQQRQHVQAVVVRVEQLSVGHFDTRDSHQPLRTASDRVPISADVVLVAQRIKHASHHYRRLEPRLLHLRPWNNSMPNRAQNADTRPNTTTN